MTNPASKAKPDATVTQLPARTWSDKLREPFPDNLVAKKPQPTCKECTNSSGKVCGRHKKIKCDGCKQYISEAHVDLDYVGHADATDRLLSVDPRWDWEPAYRAIDPETLKAAIATGNPEIVRMVIDSSPPLIDRNGGMWMDLIVHDDDGQPVKRRGYGDAAGKSGANAMKEVIGDGIRNAGMRFGIALELWSKADRDAPGADESQGRQISPAASQSAASAFDEAKPAEREQPAEARSAGAAHGLEEAKVLAQLAVQVAADPARTTDDLAAQVYQVARRKMLLATPVPDLFGDEQVMIPLNQVILTAKQRMEASQGGGA